MAKKIFEDNLPETIMGIRKYLKNRNNEIFEYIYTGGLDDSGIKKVFPILAEKYPEFHKLEGYPIGVTRLGEIICIEKMEEAHSFFFSGIPGSGKTITIHRLIDGLYNQFKYNIADLNDYQPETQSWAIHQSSREFQKKLALTTLESPRPLPLVHIIPSLKGDSPRIPQMTKVNYKINFKNLMDNIELFFDDKELGGSKKYLENIRFDGCKSIEDVEKRIDAYFKFNPKRKDVIFKIKNLIGNLINRGITNFDGLILSNVAVRKIGVSGMRHEKVDGKLISEINRGNLLSMLIECRLIPVLITSVLNRKIDFYAPYIEYHIRELIKYQDSKPQNLRNILYIKLDEMNEILNKRKSEAVLESILTLVREGRYKGIGIIGAAQNIYKIDENIISNIEYLFVFHARGESDLNMIKRRCNLDKIEVERIKHLKKFEFFASCGQKGNFIVYDILGNKKYMTKKIWGMTIPPISHHSEAGKSVTAYFESFENLRKLGYCRQLLWENKLRLENLEPSLEPSDEQHNEILALDSKNKLWDKPLNEPKLIKGINLRKVYYKDTESTRPISYDELKELGLMVYFADNIYYLGESGNWDGYGRPELKQPSNVKLILFDEEKKRVRLWGEECDNDWLNLRKE